MTPPPSSDEAIEPASIAERRDRLAAHLHARWPAQPFMLDWVPCTASTNVALQDAPTTQLEQNTPAPMRILLADRQSAGRGQSGRPWHSDAANLYASVRTQLPAPLSGALALWLARAITRAVVQACPRMAGVLGIKWPNDLYARTPNGLAKWGGLLIEPVHGREVVVGVGLNLLAAPASSRRSTGLNELLRARALPAIDVLTLAQWVLPAVVDTLHHPPAPHPSGAPDIDHLHVLHGQTVCVETAQALPSATHAPMTRLPCTRLQGQVQGIAQDGSLLLATASSVVRLYQGHVLEAEGL